MASKAVVLVVASFLLVVLILSLYSIPKASALLNKATSCSPISGIHLIQCCQTISDTGGAVVKVTCTICNDTEPPSNCGPPFTPQEGQTGPINPPTSGTLPVNNTGVTNGQTGPPNRLGILLPPSGNNTGSPGKTSIFNPPNTTNALPGNNSAATLPPGSIIKVPPGTIGSGTNPSNSTGTPPSLTISKEHNPASPNVLSLAGNATNPSNNTGPVKLSPLTTTTSGGHHHHKGTSSSNTNSTGH